MRLSRRCRVSSAALVACTAFALHAHGQEPAAPAESADTAKPAVAMAGIISAYAGGGPSKDGYGGDGGPAIDAKVASPNGVWLDKSGNLYFSDYSADAIRKVDTATGIITLEAGRGDCATGSFDCGDGGPALDAELWSPWGGTFDSEGNLYIADYSNSEVRRIDHATGIISAVAGHACPEKNTIGCHELLGFSGDGGLASNALLDLPAAVAFDAEGNLYIADSGNNAVRKVTIKTGIIETIAGRGTGCAKQTDSFGDGCPATRATLHLPEGVAFDKEGNLFIAETELVRRVDAKTGIITTYAGSIAFMNSCPNEQDKYGDGCPANAITMLPKGIAFDPEGNLNVVDVLAPWGGYVRKIDAKTGVLSRIAGGGQCTTKTYSYYCGDGGPATSAELNQPTSIAFDKHGNLYIADFHNSEVRKVTFDTTKFAQTPEFSPLPGIYHATERVRLSDATPRAVIRYTTDGKMPTAASPEYGGPIAVSETTTITVIATAPGLGESAPATATYTIERPPVVTTRAATSVEFGTVVLNATVNDDDQSGLLWFEYGTSKTALKQKTLNFSLRASPSAQNLEREYTGFASKTTYYFKAVASNASGMSSGEILSFTTK
jgi:sugar lactone lactonase YvrE